MFYSDRQIINDLKSGDDKFINHALTYLYEEYLPLANDIVTKRGGNSFWVKEIFQESMIVLYESIVNDRFHRKSSIKTYFYAIIRNQWLSAAEKIQPESLSNLPDKLESVFCLSENDDVIFRNNLVMKILEHIGDPCKQLLINYYYEKMSMKQIAEKMNYSNEKSAKTQKFKCLNKFIEFIEKRPEVKQNLNDTL